MKPARAVPVVFAIGFGFFMTACAFAQQLRNQDINLEQLIDQLLTTAEADLSYDELYETLTHLLSSPVDLNSVTVDQLRAVMILNEKEINSFVEYRKQQGPLLSTLELQAIPGWSHDTLLKILPFVTILEAGAAVGRSLLKRISREKNNYLVLRYERGIEPKQGYRSADSLHRYAGSPDKLYVRHRVSRAHDFSLGFTAEKDPGEAMVWKPATQQFGFDFLSGHLQLMKKGKLENLILGDFQCQFGQGLQLGSVFGLGKNSETITSIRRSNLGFLPYTSVSENIYMRGIAASLRLTNDLSIHSFLSYKKRDAVFNSEEQGTSLQNSGLHRTQAEIQSQKQVGDRDLGMILQLKNRRLDVGIIAFNKMLGMNLDTSPMPYNQFRFQGTSYTNLGGYFNVSWANVTFFSEVAGTQQNGWAMTAGILGNINHKLELAWLVRCFGASYYAEYANAFSESTVPQNEQGFYWGGKYTFNKRVSVAGYFDVYRFPWLRYRIHQPSDGFDWLVRVTYRPSRSVTLFGQLREEAKVRNLSDGSVQYRTGQGVKRNVWVSCDFAGTPNLLFKTRLQGSEYHLAGATSRGLALMQDVTLSHARWSISLRCALFESDDYENRLYVYEKDVWLAASLPAYEGSGVRNLVLLHYVLTRHVDLWIRWARTRYADRENIGNGLEQIDGNTRNDIKFQVRFRL